jgi:hypothetical protein
MCLKNFGGAEWSFVSQTRNPRWPFWQLLGLLDAFSVESSVARYLLARFEVDCVSVSIARGASVVVVLLP